MAKYINIKLEVQVIVDDDVVDHEFLNQYLELVTGAPEDQEPPMQQTMNVTNFEINDISGSLA